MSVGQRLGKSVCLMSSKNATSSKARNPYSSFLFLHDLGYINL